MDSSAAVIISVILAVAGMLGAAWGVFQGSSKGKTLELYEKELDLRNEINQRLERDNLALQTRFDRQAADLARWQEAVTQKARVEDLAKVIEDEIVERRRAEEERRQSEKEIGMLLRDIVGVLKGRREGSIG